MGTGGLGPSAPNPPAVPACRSMGWADLLALMKRLAGVAAWLARRTGAAASVGNFAKAYDDDGGVS